MLMKLCERSAPAMTFNSPLNGRYNTVWTFTVLIFEIKCFMIWIYQAPR